MLTNFKWGDNLSKVVIAGAVRTPVTKLDGQLKGFTEQKLAAVAITEVVNQTKIPVEAIDEVIVGNAKQTSLPSNCARHALLLAQLPERTPGYTVQRLGASGLEAVADAFWSIKSENAKLVLAGGTESMSQIPLEIEGARYKFNENTHIIFHPVEEMEKGAQPVDQYGVLGRDVIASNAAKKYGISDADMEAFAKASLEKAKAAPKKTLLPLEVKVKKEMITVDADELYDDAAVVAKPADGAAIMVMASEEEAKALNLAPMAEVVSVGIGAGSPADGVDAAKKAVAAALKKANMDASQIDLFEINEVSAAQTLAIIKEAGIDAAKVNVNGGALATGDPWGGAGSILMVKLLEELADAGKSTGMVVTPALGGQAMAVIIKK